MKRIYFILIFVIVVLFVFHLFSKNHQETKKHLYKITDFPDVKSAPDLAHDDTLLIKHGFYTAFNIKYKIPDWAAYTLSKTEVQKSVAERADRFIPEKCVATACDKDYRKAGYDKGHIVPAKDMAYSEICMKESFYYSNVCPQEPNFNRGRWKQLEEKVRDWAVDNDSVFIVTGVWYSQNEKRIGENHIIVPSYFYKAIIDITEPDVKAIAFLFKNEKTSEPVETFAITIDSLENFLKLDFFKILPDELENNVEGSYNLKSWGFIGK